MDDLVTKTMFGDRKSSASSSADTFMEIGKNLTKLFVQSRFFYLSAIIGKGELAHQK